MLAAATLTQTQEEPRKGRSGTAESKNERGGEGTGTKGKFQQFPGSFGGLERVAFPADSGEVRLRDKAGSFSLRRRCLLLGAAACVGAPGTEDCEIGAAHSPHAL